MSLDAVVQRQVVIFALPIGELRDVLKRVRTKINRDALVIDVCSVKEDPLRWMRQNLPPTVSFVGTHPLFGPSSAAESVRGKSIVLCKGRIGHKKFTALQGLLRRAGLNVLIMAPQAHDRWMARTLFVTQYIGRGIRTVISGQDSPTTAFFHLHRLMEIATADSPELLLDMYRFNRFAKILPRQLKRELSSILDFRRNR
jgi:prephenate dehydrogenase